LIIPARQFLSHPINNLLAYLGHHASRQDLPLLSTRSDTINSVYLTAKATNVDKSYLTWGSCTSILGDRHLTTKSPGSLVLAAALGNFVQIQIQARATANQDSLRRHKSARTVEDVNLQPTRPVPKVIHTHHGRI